MTEQTNEQLNDVTNQTTKVTVKFTSVKFFDGKSESLQQIDLLGKLSQPQVKTYLKELGKDKESELTFISKEYTKETFDVNTKDLYQLKQA